MPALNNAAQSQRYAAFQQALEQIPSGQQVVWTTADRTSGAIVPISTVPTKLYGWCRDYSERIATPAQRYNLVGIACRGNDGRWVLVDTRPYVEQQS